MMTPPVIRQTLPMVPWNIHKLHQLDLAVQAVAVDDLAWLFDLPLWQDNGRRFQVSPTQVRADPARVPGHMSRVMASNLQHPIHVAEHNRRLVVLDGYHRLLKAAIQGHAQIEAMIPSQQGLAVNLHTVTATSSAPAPLPSLASWQAARSLGRVAHQATPIRRTSSESRHVSRSESQRVARMSRHRRRAGPPLASMYGRDCDHG